MLGTCLLSKGNSVFAIIQNIFTQSKCEQKYVLYLPENFWQQSEIFTSFFLKLEF